MNEIRPDHNTGNYIPYSLQQVMGFLCFPIWVWCSAWRPFRSAGSPLSKWRKLILQLQTSQFITRSNKGLNRRMIIRNTSKQFRGRCLHSYLSLWFVFIGLVWFDFFRYRKSILKTLPLWGSRISRSGKMKETSNFSLLVVGLLGYWAIQCFVHSAWP